jgi:excisionase family DNA binding protein
MHKTKSKQIKQPSSTPSLLSIRQVAERVRRNALTVRRMIRTGKLKAVLVGPNVMVLEDSVDDYLRPRPYRPQKPAPVCAGWNDKLREQVRQEQSEGEAS